MSCGQNLPKSGQSKLRAGQKCLQDFEKVTQGKYCSRNVDYCDFLNSFFIWVFWMMKLWEPCLSSSSGHTLLDSPDKWGSERKFFSLWIKLDHIIKGFLKCFLILRKKNSVWEFDENKLEFRADTISMSLSQLRREVSSGPRVVHSLWSRGVNFCSEGILIGFCRILCLFTTDPPKDYHTILLIKRN